MLSISKGVSNCKYPISYIAIQNSITFQVFIYATAISTLEAAPITNFSILASMWIGALLKSSYSSKDISKNKNKNVFLLLCRLSTFNLTS